MMYTKSMIEHVQQIRKMLPNDMRPQIRLANPDLLDQLSELYWELPDLLIKEKIERLMHQAGPAWADLLQRQDKPHPRASRTYRGVELPETPKQKPDRKNPHKSKLMYRGQPI